MLFCPCLFNLILNNVCFYFFTCFSKIYFCCFFIFQLKFILIVGISYRIFPIKVPNKHHHPTWSKIQILMYCISILLYIIINYSTSHNNRGIQFYKFNHTSETNTDVSNTKKCSTSVQITKEKLKEKIFLEWWGQHSFFP